MMNSGSMDPLVSILIASYNQRDYIGDAIQSALDQDYPNLQIVVSDDGSSDGTAEIVAQFQARHADRIVAILNPINAGITRNCNVGLQHCSGDYVAFLGGDDLFLPGKIAAQVRWFDQNPDRALCGHQVEVFYDDLSRPPHRFQRILRQGAGASKVIRYGAFAACSIMVKAIRIPTGGFNELVPIVSDYLLWIETIGETGQFGYVDGIFARYRRHSSNVTNNAENTIPDVETVLSIIKEKYPSFERSCNQARARFIYYPKGMLSLGADRKSEARSAFISAVKHDYSFVRSWIGLARSLGMNIFCAGAANIVQEDKS